MPQGSHTRRRSCPRVRHGSGKHPGAIVGHEGAAFGVKVFRPFARAAHDQAQTPNTNPATGTRTNTVHPEAPAHGAGVLLSSPADRPAHTGAMLAEITPRARAMLCKNPACACAYSSRNSPRNRDKATVKDFLTLSRICSRFRSHFGLTAAPVRGFSL